VQLFVLRDGNIVDRRELFWEKVGDYQPGYLLGEVLQRYYQDNLFIPPEILIPFEIEDSERLNDSGMLYSLDVIGNKESATFSAAACDSAHEGCAIRKPLPSPHRRLLLSCSARHPSRSGSVSPPPVHAPLGLGCVPTSGSFASQRW